MNALKQIISLCLGAPNIWRYNFETYTTKRGEDRAVNEQFVYVIEVIPILIQISVITLGC